MRFTHIKNNSNKLLVYFNDMTKVGTSDNLFTAFNIINENFKDYDIIFMKDIKQNYWYLTKIEHAYTLIKQLVEQNNYNSVYGLAASSGSIPLLNILYRFNDFKKAVIINGQTTLCDEIVNKYRRSCHDCAIFNKAPITEQYDDKFITPFQNIPVNMFDKYIFFYNNTTSDTVYYEYVKSIFPTTLHKNIHYDKTNKNSHGGYVGYLLKNTQFFDFIKKEFNEFIE